MTHVFFTFHPPLDLRADEVWGGVAIFKRKHYQIF